MMMIDQLGDMTTVWDFMSFITHIDHYNVGILQLTKTVFYLSSK